MLVPPRTFRVPVRTSSVPPWLLNEMTLLESPKPVGPVPADLRNVPVAVLLIVLIGVQMLFPKANLLWVAFGVGLAYGIPFMWRLWLMYSRRK